MKKPKTIALVLALVILSFLKENFFLVINGAILGSDSYKANIDIPSFLLNKFNTGDLLKIKYGATLFFLSVFIFMTTYLIKSAFNDKSKAKLILNILLLLVAISFIFFGLNLYTNHVEFYNLFIKILHFVQSPLPFFISLPIFYFIVKKS